MITGCDSATKGDGSLAAALVDLLSEFNLPYGVLVMAPLQGKGVGLKAAEALLEAGSIAPAVLGVGCDDAFQALAGQMARVIAGALDDKDNARRIMAAFTRADNERN